MTSTGLITENKPHAVCMPVPAQGHINPMFKLAILLHQKGFHITFVNTESNHQRFLKTRGPNSLDGLPSFRFKTIPDGRPELGTDSSLAPFREILVKLNDTVSSNVPPVSCIVSDAIMTFTLEGAQDFGIPQILFYTSSACSYLAFAQFKKLIEKGYIPMKDASYLTNGYLDTVVEDLDDDIPGMKGISLRDFPDSIRTTDQDDFMIKFLLQELERAKSVSAIVLNTFDDLERDAIVALSSTLSPTYSIGPLHLLEKCANNEGLEMLGSNLWKEEPECLEWLDSKQPNSVVYVNFGSGTVLTHDQLVEFAWGLANSNQFILWIIRPDLVSGVKVVLPTEFLEATKERRWLGNWCPQQKVLSHPSIGGFLTHSGWNSTIESMCSGVPMICWPFFSDQYTNCWLCCKKWGIGMEIDNDVKRAQVKGLVNELMIGDKGKEMRKKAMEWKKMAHDSVNTSSIENLEKLIHQVLLPLPNV